MKSSSRQVITLEQFADLTASLVGLPVSSAWRGYGSALFFELGELRPAEPPGRHERGEAHVMIQWSWRIERARSIEVGSWSTDARIDAGIKRLTGPHVTSLAVDGRLPELIVALSDGRWVRSFMTAEGQPQWVVFLQDESWVTVEGGSLIHDTQNQTRHVHSNPPAA